MRQDRVIPPTGSTGIDGGLGFYQPGGFGNVLIGNPRSEPGSGFPTVKIQTMIERRDAAAPSAATPGVATGLATSSSTSPVTDGIKKYWPWLLVAGLAGAALWVK